VLTVPATACPQPQVLLGYVLFFVLNMFLSGWKLTPRVGYVFFVAHACFMVWVLLSMLDNPVISLPF
jgi:hypothetical protein